MLERQVGHYSPQTHWSPIVFWSQPQPVTSHPVEAFGLQWFGCSFTRELQQTCFIPKNTWKSLGTGERVLPLRWFLRPSLGHFLRLTGVTEGWNGFCYLAVPYGETGAPFPAMEVFHFVLCVFYQCFQPCCLIWAVNRLKSSLKKLDKET